MTVRKPAAFDSHVDDYEAELARGLALSGEGQAFFARGRIAWLRDALLGRGCAEPRRIVDYGCGTGLATSLLAESFPRAEILGLDPSARCVARASERHGGGRVRFATLDGFSTGAGPADLVHVNGVVHHVAVGARPALFAAIAELAGADGRVAVFENNPLNPGTRLVMRRIPFDRDAKKVSARELRRRLHDAGLEPLDTAYLFWFPHVLRGLRALEPLLVRVPLGAQYGVLARPRAAGV